MRSIVLSNIKRIVSRHKSLPASKMGDEAARIPGTDRYDVKSTTRRQYRKVGALIRKYFGHDIDVTTMTREDYADFHQWLLDRNSGSTVTVNSYRRVCRAVWNRLRDRGWQLVDIRGITRMEPEPTPDGKAITDDHLAWLMSIANIRDLAMILVAAQSGCRRQTLARLRQSQMKLWEGPDGRYRVAFKIPSEKGGRPRMLFAQHEAALAIMTWLAIRRFDSDHLFNSLNDGEPLTVFGVETAMRKLRERSNLPLDAHAHWHALRHRFAQKRLNHFDAKVVADWMGISVETVLLVYAARTNEELEALYFGDAGADSSLL